MGRTLQGWLALQGLTLPSPRHPCHSHLPRLEPPQGFSLSHTLAQQLGWQWGLALSVPSTWRRLLEGGGLTVCLHEEHTGRRVLTPCWRPCLLCLSCSYMESREEITTNLGAKYPPGGGVHRSPRGQPLGRLRGGLQGLRRKGVKGQKEGRVSSVAGWFLRVSVTTGGSGRGQHEAAMRLRVGAPGHRPAGWRLVGSLHRHAVTRPGLCSRARENTDRF